MVVDYWCTSNLLLFLASNFNYVSSSIYIFLFISIPRNLRYYKKIMNFVITLLYHWKIIYAKKKKYLFEIGKKTRKAKKEQIFCGKNF